MPLPLPYPVLTLNGISQLSAVCQQCIICGTYLAPPATHLHSPPLQLRHDIEGRPPVPKEDEGALSP